MTFPSGGVPTPREASVANKKKRSNSVDKTPFHLQTTPGARVSKSAKTGTSSESSVQSAELVTWKQRTAQHEFGPSSNQEINLSQMFFQAQDSAAQNNSASPVALGSRLSLAADEAVFTEKRSWKKGRRRRHVLKNLGENDANKASSFGEFDFEEDDDFAAEIDNVMSKIEKESPDGNDPYAAEWEKSCEIALFEDTAMDGLFCPTKRYSSFCRLMVTAVVSEGYNEQTLELVETVSSSPRTCTLTLRDEWAVTEQRLEAGDKIHVVAIEPLVGGFAPSTPVFERVVADGVVGSTSPFAVIAHPDIFVTPTRISDATSCERKALLGHILGSARSSSKALVVGSFKHELFGTVVPALSDYSTPAERDHAVRRIVDGGTASLYGLGIDSSADVVRDCRAFVDGIVDDWAPSFLSTPRGNVAKGVFLAADDARRVAIKGVDAIENAVWSPLLGVSGNVDASVHVENWGMPSANGGSRRQPQRAVVPLELKSGREHIAHSAQVALYVGVDRANRLLQDRDEEEGDAANDIGGLLLYATVDNRDASKQQQHREDQRTRMRHVNLKANEIKSILAARNRLAGAVRRAECRAAAAENEFAAVGGAKTTIVSPTFVLPKPLQNKNECGRCFAVATCALHHCCAEDGDAESFGCGDDLWKRALSGSNDDDAQITPAERQYYKSWMTLLDLEASQSTPAARLVLSESGIDRERSGKACVANLSAVCEPKRIDDGRKLMFELSLTRVEQMVDEDEGSTSRLASGDFVLVSIERGSGPTRRVAMVGRGVAVRVEASGGISAEANVDVRSDSPIKIILGDGMTRVRVDKDETVSCIAKARNNIASLFIDVADNARDDATSGKKSTNNGKRRAVRAERRRALRSLVVGLKAPRFNEAIAEEALQQAAVVGGLLGTRWGGQGCSFDALNESWGTLNEEQRTAARRALSAEDYALVLGMPGTGKTSTIEFVVRCLIALGKRVLVSSYTHAAVDNVLIRLLDSGVSPRSIARLAAGSAIDRVDNRLRERCVDYDLGGKGTNRLGSLRSRLGQARVVGCTCLSVPTDPVLARLPEFDVAIVDEAGQVSQPVVLAPLFEAKSFVLVGDPQQLAPLSTSRLARHNGYSVSLFERLSTSHPGSIAVLAAQYRMNQHIMDMANAALEHALDGRRLVCGSSEVANARLALDWNAVSRSTLLRAALRAPVTFIDVPAHLSEERDRSSRSSSSSSSSSNVAESDVVAEVVRGLLDAGARPDDIAVLTPFRAQVKSIGDRLDGGKLVQQVSTIDRFQGKDAPCVVLSLVKRAPPLGDLLADAKRVNVALSRAKHQLILIGCADVLKSHSDVFRRLVEKAAGDGVIHRLTTAVATTICDGGGSSLKTDDEKFEATSITLKDKSSVVNRSWHPSRSTHPVLADIAAENEEVSRR